MRILSTLIYSILFSLLIFFSGCTTTSSDLKLLVDQTCDICPSLKDEIRSLAMSSLGIDNLNQVTRNSCKVSCSFINGLTYRPKIQDSLLSAPIFLLRVDKDRIEDTNIFFDKSIDQMITASKEITVDTTRTYFYHNLFLNVNELSKSSAKNKICAIYGDALEYTDDLSFYDYRFKPQGIISDYDSLKIKLELLYGDFPDLTGIKVILTHVPVQRDMLLFEYSSRFLKKLIKEHNGSFQLRTCRIISHELKEIDELSI